MEGTVLIARTTMVLSPMGFSGGNPFGRKTTCVRSMRVAELLNLSSLSRTELAVCRLACTETSTRHEHGGSTPLIYVCRDVRGFPSFAVTLYDVGGRLACKDPRDHIYALLGLQNSPIEVDIPVDYTKSVEDVYIDCARRLIADSQSLRVLEFGKETDRTSPQVSSLRLLPT